MQSWRSSRQLGQSLGEAWKEAKHSEHAAQSTQAAKLSAHEAAEACTPLRHPGTAGGLLALRRPLPAQRAPPAGSLELRPPPAWRVPLRVPTPAPPVPASQKGAAAAGGQLAQLPGSAALPARSTRCSLVQHSSARHMRHSTSTSQQTVESSASKRTPSTPRTTTASADLSSTTRACSLASSAPAPAAAKSGPSSASKRCGRRAGAENGRQQEVGSTRPG